MKNNKTLENLIMKMINIDYDIIDNEIICVNEKYALSPKDLSKIIVDLFNINVDMSDYIIFNWLYKNEFKDIRINWNRIYTRHDIISPNVLYEMASMTNTGSTFSEIYHGVDMAYGFDSGVTLTIDWDDTISIV